MNKQEEDKQSIVGFRHQSYEKVVQSKDNMVYISDPDMMYDYTGRKQRGFAFDHVFQPNNQNIDVFEGTIAPMLESCLEGYNATCFAYGMTGTGKTHTMFGNIVEGYPQEKGLCLQSVERLFDLMEEMRYEKDFLIKISYLEIYNEYIRDLLVDGNTNLQVMEDSARGVFVQDLREILVTEPNQLVELIQAGNVKRTMASTSTNQFSSRSHAIL